MLAAAQRLPESDAGRARRHCHQPAARARAAKSAVVRVRSRGGKMPALIASAGRLSPESLASVAAIIDKLGVAAAGDPPR